MSSVAHDHPEHDHPEPAGHGGGHASPPPASGHDAHAAHAAPPGHAGPAGHDAHAGHHAPPAPGAPAAHDGHDAHGAPAGHDAHGAPAGHDAHGAPAGHDAHGAHGGGHANDPHLGRNVGITMAVMGVLLAFSSALVGGERTELVSAMIEHTSTSGRYQSVSTKYRVLQSQLQQLHATMPREAELARNEAELKKAEAEIAKLESDAKVPPHASLAMRSLRVQTKLILDTVAPTRSDLLRLAGLVRHYMKEREAAHEWAESFEPSIKIHETAAERYELASLFAEIGIVMASIALLLHSRKAWLTAIVIGCASVTILAATGTDCHVRLKAANNKIVEGRESYEKWSKNSTEEADDERLLRVVTGQEEEAEASPEHGKPEHGTPEHGTPEHGTPEHGTPEHGTPEPGKPAHGGEHH